MEVPEKASKKLKGKAVVCAPRLSANRREQGTKPETKAKINQ